MRNFILPFMYTYVEDQLSCGDAWNPKICLEKFNLEIKFHLFLKL